MIEQDSRDHKQDKISQIYQSGPPFSDSPTVFPHRKGLLLGLGSQKSKQEPSIFLKIKSKHCQVISSKFPKSFRSAGDLVVFYDFL